MLDLCRLRALRALSTHGSVPTAATGFRCPGLAASQQLASLEKEVGLRLPE
jgi:DNA-binding transcriptional LysR family regulator